MTFFLSFFEQFCWNWRGYRTSFLILYKNGENSEKIFFFQKLKFFSLNFLSPPFWHSLKIKSQNNFITKRGRMFPFGEYKSTVWIPHMILVRFYKQYFDFSFHSWNSQNSKISHFEFFTYSFIFSNFKKIRFKLQKLTFLLQRFFNFFSSWKIFEDRVP